MVDEPHTNTNENNEDDVKMTAKYVEQSVDKLIEEMRRDNPYPENVFSDKSPAEWKEFHKALQDAGIVYSEGFMGSFGRLVWNNCLDELEKRMKGEK